MSGFQKPSLVLEVALGCSAVVMWMQEASAFPWGQWPDDSVLVVCFFFCVGSQQTVCVLRGRKTVLSAEPKGRNNFTAEPEGSRSPSCRCGKPEQARDTLSVGQQLGKHP